MAREIQWDDVRVERAGAGTSAGASWTPTGDRVWSVLRDGQRFKVECLEGPDDQGNLVVRINGVRRACRVLDERTKLLEMMGMSVTAGQKAARGWRLSTRASQPMDSWPERGAAPHSSAV